MLIIYVKFHIAQFGYGLKWFRPATLNHGAPGLNHVVSITFLFFKPHEFSTVFCSRVSAKCSFPHGSLIQKFHCSIENCIASVLCFILASVCH